MIRKSSKRHLWHNLLSSKLKLLFTFLLFIGIVLIILEVTNTTHLFHSASKTAAPKIIPTKNRSSQTTTNKTNQTAPTSSATDTNKDTAPSSSSNSTTSGTDAPKTPYGTFVSNHQPPQNGDYSEVSTCITSPGASCQMSFTDGNITKNLPAQTTDSSGSTTWDWDAKQAGLTPGHWTITITATLNGKTAAAHDSMDVGP